jgi:hypothetical protein
MNYKYLISAIIGAVAIGSVFSLNQKAHIVQSNDFSLEEVVHTSPPKDKASENSQSIMNVKHKNAVALSKPHGENHNDNPIERFRSQIDKSDLKTNLVKEYDKFKRYPPENNAFETEAQDPVTQRYAVDERTTLNEDKNMGLTIWSNEKYYLLNDSVNIYAYIQDAEGTKIPTSFITTAYFDENQSIGDIALTDDNNDGVYEGQLELTQQNTLSKGPGIYKVRIQDIKNKLTDSLTFTLSQPDISLTGNYKEGIDQNGNLVIDAEVSIGSNNNFYIQASLYSSTQVAIGVTQFSQQLTKGNHWIPLSFSGLMIQDAQESGPYVLKKVSVAKVTMPMQRAPLIEPDFHTDSYALSEFSQ